MLATYEFLFFDLKEFKVNLYKYFIFMLVLMCLMGCSNYAAVKQFSKSGKELSRSLTNAQHLDYKSCLSAAELSELTRLYEGVANGSGTLLPNYLDSLKARQSKCEPYLGAEKNLLQITSHLELFYTKLEEIADSGISTSVDKNIKGLEDSVKEIPGANPAIVAAAGSIGKFTARLILAKKQDREIQDALAIMPQVNELLEGIKYYYSAIYFGFLKDEKTKVIANSNMLEEAERQIHENATKKGAAVAKARERGASEETLASLRYADYSAQVELVGVRSELERYSLLQGDIQLKIDMESKITSAISNMQKQNLTIMENYKKLDKEEYFSELSALYKQLKEINKNINAISEEN